MAPTAAEILHFATIFNHPVPLFFFCRKQCSGGSILQQASEEARPVPPDQHVQYALLAAEERRRQRALQRLRPRARVHAARAEDRQCLQHQSLCGDPRQVRYF